MRKIYFKTYINPRFEENGKRSKMVEGTGIFLEEAGWLIEWSTAAGMSNYYRSGSVGEHYPVAIVETETGEVRVIPAQMIRFEIPFLNKPE